MNTKISLSLLSIVATFLLAAGATFAFFSDEATTTGNTFSTGNADLQVSLDNAGTPVSFSDSIAGPSFEGLFPGDERPFFFWLKNNSATGVNMDVTADVDAITPANDLDQQIDNLLLVSWACDTNSNGLFTDETFTSEFSPRDWLTGGDGALPDLASGAQFRCQMLGELPESVDNSVSGQSVSFDVVYNGVQATTP